jgi:uncharacterized membrane protein (UPF0127 family)
MENTYIPLTVAFVDQNMKIVGMDDMQALTQTLHSSPSPYQYAIEANLGYFAAHNIRVGDTVQLSLQAGSSPLSRLDVLDGSALEMLRL